MFLIEWLQRLIGWLVSFLFSGLPILALLALPGCSLSLGGAGSEVRELLKSPEVQKTLREWAVKSDFTNPEIELYTKTSIGARAIGTIMRSEAKGSAGGSGIPGSEDQPFSPPPAAATGPAIRIEPPVTP